MNFRLVHLQSTDLRSGQLYWAAFPDLISDNTHVIVSTNVKVPQMLENKQKMHLEAAVLEVRAWDLLDPMPVVAQLHTVF